jgi:hypothetical protein
MVGIINKYVKFILYNLFLIEIIMYQDFNNPSYYRAHHFKDQLELPNGALKNRSIPQYYS